MEEVSSGTIALIALGALVFLIIFFVLVIRFVVHGQEKQEKK